MSSFMPEKPFLVFPSLAAAIGLEEAVMLSLLDDMAQNHIGQHSRGYTWFELDDIGINTYMGFWSELDIQRTSQRLKDLGLILLLSAPYSESLRLKFAFNKPALQQLQNNPQSNFQNSTHNTPQSTHQNNHQSSPQNNTQNNAQGNAHNSPQAQRVPLTQSPPVTQPTPQPYARPDAQQNIHRGASLISANWQPDRETLTALSQLNIPEHFARENTPEFVRYWRERGDTNRAWGSKFVSHVKRQWSLHVTQQNSTKALPESWQPSAELLQHIAQEGIPATAVQKSLRRFSLHHRQKKTQHANWDMPFYSWLKDDWEKQDTPFIDRKSTSIQANWQPDEHTITYLSHSQGIDIAFINDCVPEFVHKWIEKKAVYSEWGSVFAKHILEQWSFVQDGVNKNPVPQIIKPQWRPSGDCLEILETHSGIEREFIEQQIAEFILYWTNRAQPMHSWDNNFLRHVKYKWKQHYETQQSTSGTGRTKDRSIAEQLTDTSWAS